MLVNSQVEDAPAWFVSDFFETRIASSRPLTCPPINDVRDWLQCLRDTWAAYFTTLPPAMKLASSLRLHVRCYDANESCEFDC